MSIAAGAALAKPPPIHWPITNPLPQTQTGNANLVSVTAWDALGHKLSGVTALVPNWNRTNLPFFPIAIPQGLRNAIALRTPVIWNEWIAVPKSWIPYNTTRMNSIGSGPDDVSFVAPAGRTSGWMIVVQDSGYSGDDQFDGNGFFPDAKALIFGAYDAPHPPPPQVSIKLAPMPSSVERPSGCVVEFAYPSGSLSVHGAAVISPYRQPNNRGQATYAADLDEIFVAMPRNETALQAFIIGAFLAEHDQNMHCPAASS